MMYATFLPSNYTFFRCSRAFYRKTPNLNGQMNASKHLNIWRRNLPKNQYWRCQINIDHSKLKRCFEICKLQQEQSLLKQTRMATHFPPFENLFPSWTKLQYLWSGITSNNPCTRWMATLGLFTIAIFGSFLGHFYFIFHSILNWEWKKNECKMEP
jgi:hypothetical protein